MTLTYSKFKEKHASELTLHKKLCRAFMIIAYDPANPANVWGFNSKEASFYYGKGCVYSFEGRQPSDMINYIVKRLHSIRHFKIKDGYVKRPTHKYANGDHDPRSHVGFYFRCRKHLNRGLKFKIIRLSSDKCPYLVYGADFTSRRYPMAKIMLHEKAIECYRNENVPESDALKIHHALLNTIIYSE